MNLESTYDLINIEWNRTANRPSIQREDTQVADTAISSFSNDYIPSDEYITAVQDSGLIDDELSTTLKAVDEYGSLEEVTTNEFELSQKTSIVEEGILDFWTKNLSNENLNARDTLYATYLISNSSNSSNNEYVSELNKMLSNISKLPESITSREIPKRDPQGKPTGKTMTVAEFAQEARGNHFTLKKYINDPAVRSALTHSARDIKNSDDFKESARYDRNEAGAGWAVGGTLGLGAILGGIGALFSSGAVTAGGVGSVLALGASGPVGWIIGGMVLAGLTVVAISSVSQSVEYIGNNRNDAPTSLMETPGFMFMNYMESIGLFSNKNV